MKALWRAIISDQICQISGHTLNNDNFSKYSFSGGAFFILGPCGNATIGYSPLLNPCQKVKIPKCITMDPKSL